VTPLLARAEVPPDEVDVIAAFVRRELEALAVDAASPGRHDPTLGGWCGVASAALVVVARAAGFEARLGEGAFRFGAGEDDLESHFWALVKPSFATAPEQWVDYASVVDLTATQFEVPETPRVVRLDPCDPRRALYQLEVAHEGDPIARLLELSRRCVGLGMRVNDHVVAEHLLRRVQTALARRPRPGPHPLGHVGQE
jgi:hypothetical protein